MIVEELLKHFANLYENFLHENFYTRSNYSNRAVIYVNHTKIFLHENFYHENKVNYGSGLSILFPLPLTIQVSLSH